MAGIVTASGRSCAVEYLDAIVLARDPAGARSRTGHSRGDAGRAWPQCVKAAGFHAQQHTAAVDLIDTAGNKIGRELRRRAGSAA